MLGLLVCALVLSVGLAHANSSPCICNYGSYHGSSRGVSKSVSSRIDATDGRIARMLATLQALRTRIDNGQQKREEVVQTQAYLRDRLDKIEGGHCDKKHEYFCGEGDNTCISDLMVCDGEKDCPHNQDEAHCVNHASSGSVFFAEIHAVSQCTTRHINSIKMIVTSVEQLKWFPSRILLKFSIVIDFTTKDARRVDTLQAVGYFDFARTRYIILPPEADRLGIVCEFHGNNGDEASCAVLREGTLERCLTFRAIRKQ